MSRKSGPVRRHLRPVATAQSPDRTALVDELLAALRAVPAFGPIVEEASAVRGEPTAVAEVYDRSFRVVDAETDEMVDAIRELARDATTAFRAEALAAHFVAGFLVADEAQRLDRAEDGTDDGTEADDSFSGLLLHLSVTHPEPSVMFLARASESIGRPDHRAVARVAAQRLRLAGVAEPKWARSIGRPTFHSAFVTTADADTTDMGTLVVHFEYSHRLHAIIALIDRTEWAEGGLKGAFASEVADASELRLSDLVSGLAIEDLTQEQAAAALDAALAVPARPGTVDQADSLLDTMPLVVARRRIMTPHRPELLAPLIRLDDVADEAPTAVYRLRATVKGSRPSIWRELVVDVETAVLDLHQILEIAFDLDGGLDPWQFDHQGSSYGVVGEEFVDLETQLDDLALEPGDRLRWTAGDVPPVDLEVLGAEEPEVGVLYPHCADGSWAFAAGPDEEPRRFRPDHVNQELDEWMTGDDGDHEDLDDPASDTADPGKLPE